MKAASHSSITGSEFLVWAQGQERGRSGPGLEISEFFS
jgi:hypothetical protein